MAGMQFFKEEVSKEQIGEDAYLGGMKTGYQEGEEVRSVRTEFLGSVRKEYIKDGVNAGWHDALKSVNRREIWWGR